MPTIGGQIAQVRPSDTDTQQVFTAVIGTDISRVFVCNTTSTAARFRVFHRTATGDPDATNALWYDQEVAGNTSYLGSEQMKILMRQGDRLFVRSDTANALTFSFYGNTAIPPPSRDLR